jgi:hypothetical protein
MFMGRVSRELAVNRPAESDINVIGVPARPQGTSRYAARGTETADPVWKLRKYS